jgi:predicted glycosyltransferase involved in capsule biosynthesis
MIDTSDLTLVIPFKYDTEDRINNLRFVLKYYKKNFIDTKFVIIESGVEQRGKEFEGQHNVYYEFREETGLMHRTKMLNDGAKIAKTKFISAYDTDVFFKKDDTKRTMDALRSGKNYVLPFNGIFLDVARTAKTQVEESLDAEFLPMIPHLVQRGNTIHGDLIRCIVNNSVGGALFYNRERFLQLGGYNEKFISWGHEDNEIEHRFRMMGDPIFKIENSNCYHLNHRRGKDSQMEHAHTANNKQELAKVRSMDRPTLEKYIQEELIK